MFKLNTIAQMRWMSGFVVSVGFYILMLVVTSVTSAPKGMAELFTVIAIMAIGLLILAANIDKVPSELVVRLRMVSEAVAFYLFLSMVWVPSAIGAFDGNNLQVLLLLVGLNLISVFSSRTDVEDIKILFAKIKQEDYEFL